jgi:hypothetical protein
VTLLLSVGVEILMEAVYNKLASTFVAFLQRFSQVLNKTLCRHAALSGQPSQKPQTHGKTTMETRSPTINPTTQLKKCVRGDI